MWNSAPFDEWSDTITIFWTFGGGDPILWDQASVGTWILMLLGFIVMCWAFVRFVTLENGKLARQAEALRASGALNRPADQTPTS